MTDARFEDGRDGPVNLGALDGDDLLVLSALTQDAVFPATEMKWDRKTGRFALLLNRFRWEEGARRAASPERVQSLLSFDLVSQVATNGIDRKDPGTVLSLLVDQLRAHRGAGRSRPAHPRRGWRDPPDGRSVGSHLERRDEALCRAFGQGTG